MARQEQARIRLRIAAATSWIAVIRNVVMDGKYRNNKSIVCFYPLEILCNLHKSGEDRVSGARIGGAVSGEGIMSPWRRTARLAVTSACRIVRRAMEAASGIAARLVS